MTFRQDACYSRPSSRDFSTDAAHESVDESTADFAETYRLFCDWYHKRSRTSGSTTDQIGDSTGSTGAWLVPAFADYLQQEHQALAERNSVAKGGSIMYDIVLLKWLDDDNEHCAS
jgi:hypothetical protein